MSQNRPRHDTSHAPRVPGDARPIHIDGARPKAPSAIYRELRMKGFGPDEAGNLTAYVNGIRPVDSGWTPHEIERLLFLHHVVERGRSDARRSVTDD